MHATLTDQHAHHHHYVREHGYACGHDHGNGHTITTIGVATAGTGNK